MNDYNQRMIEANSLLFDTQKQFMETPDEYWQGCKDGARRMLMIFVDEERRESLQDVLDNSYGGGRKFDHEIVSDLLEDAVYNIAAIVYEINYEKPHPQTRHNLKQWIERYEYLSRERGLFPVIDDHCLSEN